MNLLFLTYLAIVALAWPEFAPAAQSLTVQALMDRAVERNAELQARRLEVTARRARADQAGRLDDLNLQIGAGRRDEPVGRTGLASVGFSQNIPRPGRLRAKQNAALAEAELFEADARISELELRGKVLELIYLHRVATEKAAHAKERFDRFKTVQSYLKSRPFAAPKSRAEAMIVRAKLLVLQKEMREMQVDQRISWNNLNLFLGLETEPHIEVPWYKRGPDFDSSSLAAKAEGANPDVKRGSLRLGIQEGELKAARYDSWQGLTFSGLYSGGSGANPEHEYTLGVSFPLPLWNANRGAIAAGEALRRSEEAKLKWSRAKLDADLKSSLARYQLAAATIRDFSPERIPDQERDMRDVDSGFKKGQIDLITYIEADAGHFESLNAILDAQADFVAALRELLFLVGEAPQPSEI